MQGFIQEFIQRLRLYVSSSDRSRLISIIALVLILAAIPLTIFVARRQQELRQRAAPHVSPPAPPVSLVLSPSSGTKIVGDEFDVTVTLKAEGNTITGVFTNISLSTATGTGSGTLEVVTFRPSETLNTKLISNFDPTTRTLRYAAVDTSAGNITGDITLGTLKLRAKAPGTGIAVFRDDAQVTALGAIGKLPLQDNINGSYLVALPPTATPIPTNTPIPTATPTLTPTPTPLPTVPLCRAPTIPPQTGPAPLLVTLHGAGQAGGPDSGIVGYQWDFDGNGIWDSGIQLDAINHVYTLPGTYDPVYKIRGANNTWSDICIYPFRVVVSAPTPTPTPLPTATPVPTATPTPLPTATPTLVPPSPTPTPAPGDIDRDGNFTILDFNLWRDAFLAEVSGQPVPDRRADVDGNGTVDLVDFSIWRNGFRP